jgi:recombination protein RecA
MTKPKQDSAPAADPLKAFLDQANKEFGQGSIMSLGDGAIRDIERITTGSIAFDQALGGGLPRGRIVEIFGPESCGKTTIALQAIEREQHAGGLVAYIDAEHALDPDYCRSIGIDTDHLYISQPDTGEQALGILDLAVHSGVFDIIVIDSVAALVPKAEIDGEMGDSHMGLQARLMSQAMRKIAGGFAAGGPSGKPAVAIFINQLREKIGVVFGNPEVTSGGKALKYYASVRIDVRAIERLKNGSSEAHGNKLRVKVVKNKVAPPFRTAEFDLLFGKGISREGELVDLGTQLNILAKNGTFYKFVEDAPAVQGRDNARDWLVANPAVADQLEAAVRDALAAGSAPVVVPEPAGNPFATT